MVKELYSILSGCQLYAVNWISRKRSELLKMKLIYFMETKNDILKIILSFSSLRNTVLVIMLNFCSPQIFLFLQWSEISKPKCKYEKLETNIDIWKECQKHSSNIVNKIHMCHFSSIPSHCSKNWYVRTILFQKLICLLIHNIFVHIQYICSLFLPHFLIHYVGIYKVWNRVRETELHKMTSHFELLARKFS